MDDTAAGTDAPRARRRVVRWFAVAILGTLVATTSCGRGSATAGDVTSATQGGTTPGTAPHGTEPNGTVPAAPGTAPDGSAAPRTTGAEGAFCDALGEIVSMSGNQVDALPKDPNLTPEAREQLFEILRTSVIPVVERVRAATPAELQGSVDQALNLYRSLVENGGDFGQVLGNLMDDDPETDRAFMDYARTTCALDDAALDDVSELLVLTMEDEGGCSPKEYNGPKVAGQERLLTLPEVNLIEGFERLCPFLPRSAGPAAADAVQAPCGGAIDQFDVAGAPVGTYGILLPQIVEVLAEPGEARAKAFVDQMSSGLVTGCAPTASTMSDVTRFDLDLRYPSVAFSAHTTEAFTFFGSDSAIAGNVFIAAVRNGPELLVLAYVGPKLPPTRSFELLTKKALARAGW